MSPTYLHEIPETARHHVARHLSSKPSRLNWIDFVVHEDALMAIHPSSALSGDARTLFTRLTTMRSETEDRNMIHVKLDSSFPSCLTKWFQCVGESITELETLHYRMNLNPGAMESMLNALEKNCHALQRLHIYKLSRNPCLSRAYLGR